MIGEYKTRTCSIHDINHLVHDFLSKTKYISYKINTGTNKTPKLFIKITHNCQYSASPGTNTIDKYYY